MIIWRGKGILIALIAFGCLLLAEYATRSAFHDDRYYQTHGWPKLAAMWLAAGLVFALQSKLGGGPPRVLVDKETGKEISLPARDALFFIPVRYWPPILAALGVAFFLCVSEC